MLGRMAGGKKPTNQKNAFGAEALNLAGKQATPFSHQKEKHAA
jgi:hypothetical protein